MSKIKKVYTKTGDKGHTALINGERLAKNSLIFEVLGTLDEFNAHLGLVVLEYRQAGLTGDLALAQLTTLLDLQNELFKLGAEIALSPRVRLNDQFVSRLETSIDALQADLGANWRYKFVLPGGSEASATIDVARTVCRRLERRIVALDNERDVREVVLQFVNRVSDYLFALRTWLNAQSKVEEVEFDANK
jgi:cob(I)alamin adenosyltransferase